MDEICFYTTNVHFFESGAELQATLEARSGVLADIRPLTARATATEAGSDVWQSSTGLHRHFGRRYRRVAPLAVRTDGVGGSGGGNGGGGNALIHHLALGVRIIESWRQNVILLCDCPVAFDADCHRHQLARELRRRKFPVADIDAEQLTRLRAESKPKPEPKLAPKPAPIDKTAAKPILRQTTAHAVPAVAPQASPFSGGVITLVCGTPGNLERFETRAEIVGGLAVHPVYRAETHEYAVTHIATGRQVCRAANEKAAKYLATRLLALNADWTRAEPWDSAAQAQQLKNEIGAMLNRMNEV